MVINKYGISLKRLQVEDIELVRQWRNLPDVKQYMEYQQCVTPIMQQQWYEQLNPKNDFYFIIEHNTTKIGVINVARINWETKIGECGIFIGHQDYQKSPVVAIAVLSLLDFAFEQLQLTRTIVKVHNNNKKAVKYNTTIGYKPLEHKQAHKDFKYYYLDNTYYFSKCHKIRNFASKLST